MNSLMKYQTEDWLQKLMSVIHKIAKMEFVFPITNDIKSFIKTNPIIKDQETKHRNKLFNTIGRIIWTLYQHTSKIQQARASFLKKETLNCGLLIYKVDS